MSQMNDMEIKLESNELQTYLDTFNKEIEEGNESLNAALVDAADLGSLQGKEEDDNEETGTYFVDQAGNYYYQATKDSDPIPTGPPENVHQIVDDSDIEDFEPISKLPGKRRKISTSVKNISKKSKSDADNTNYVLVLGDEKVDNGQEDEDENENDNGNEENNEYNDEEDDDDDDDDNVEEAEVYDFDEADESSSKKSSVLLSTKVVRLRTKTNEANLTSHQCPHCEYLTSKRYLLARHMKCHSEERPHKCPVCERGFKTNASLQNHANTHTGNKPHRCKHCTSTFTTSGELVRHVRYKHTHEKPHKCFECDYASVELSKLKRHIRCHTGERPYQCPHCTYASPDTFKLKRHMRTHTGEKPYECDICHSKFTQSNSLKAHKLIHSVGDKPVFQCHLCPTTCGRKTDLRIHIQKLHTSERPISCKRCGKMFPDRYTYKVHSKTHEGEKCFKCDLCPYASISQRHLDSHLLIHTDQKPYDCNFCEQSFRQKQLLRRHENLYHNKDYVPPKPQEKTHTCPDCKRAFSRKGNLMRHMASHDPDSKMSFDKLRLKLGRMNRIVENGDDGTVEILSEVDEDEDLEDEYEMGEEEESAENQRMVEADEGDEDDDDEEVETIYADTANLVDDITSITIKKEDENELVSLEGIEGQQYMVVEVIQCEDENENDLSIDATEKTHHIKNEMDDEFIISELTDEGVNIMKSSKSAEMDDCFGFSESDDNIDLRGTSDGNRDNKNGIQLLKILQ